MATLLSHPEPLLPGVLLARYVRFIAEVRLDDGQVVRAHCVNPGAMEGQVVVGARVWLARAHGAKRKLRYTWVLMREAAGAIAGVDTTAPNRIVARALEARAISGLRRYRALRSEVQVEGSSRIDFLLEAQTPHYVEVKNAHLIYPDGRAYFPDSVSERASHHIARLEALVRGGARATVLFVVQRDTAPRSVRPSALHDPSFADACRRAHLLGVRFRALQAIPSVEGYRLGPELPVDLRPYDTSKHRDWRRANRPTSGWKRSPKA